MEKSVSHLSTYPHIAEKRATEWRRNQPSAPGTKWTLHSAIHVQGHHPGLSQRAMKTGSCCCCAQLTWEEGGGGAQVKVKPIGYQSGRQTHLSSFSSNAILSKCRWSRCPSLASINQWQLRLLPLLWLLTGGGGGDSIRPTVALRIHPPQDTAEKNTWLKWKTKKGHIDLT